MAAKAHVLGGNKFMTQDAWQALLERFLNLPEERQSELLDTMAEYWLDNQEVLKRLGVKLPTEVREGPQRIRLHQIAKFRPRRMEDLNLPLDPRWYTLLPRLSTKTDEVPLLKELKEILTGKWDGKPHWTVED